VIYMVAATRRGKPYVDERSYCKAFYDYGEAKDYYDGFVESNNDCAASICSILESNEYTTRKQSLINLKERFEKVASDDTNFFTEPVSKEWRAKDQASDITLSISGPPLTGHCGCVSHYIQDVYGGVVLSANVDMRVDMCVKKVRHMWNRLPDGEEVDLTSDQFGGNGYHPIAIGRKVKPRKTVNPRFELFANRVLSTYNKENK